MTRCVQCGRSSPDVTFDAAWEVCDSCIEEQGRRRQEERECERQKEESQPPPIREKGADHE